MKPEEFRGKPIAAITPVFSGTAPSNYGHHDADDNGKDQDQQQSTGHLVLRVES
jgi:hypothetical protein